MSKARTICCLWAIFFAQSAAAQEVQWRYDYNAARREAIEKGKPLFLDLGTDNCFWCKKLDASTLKDPTIVRLLNEQFIALKINASRDATLADLLQVQSYPTLIFAAPDGKILASVEGFQEVSRLQEQLRRVAATATTAGASREIQDAAEALKTGDCPRAIALLKQALLEGKDSTTQTKATQLWHLVEERAANQLLRARQLDEARRSAEAMTVLVDVQKTYAGTQAAVDAGQMLVALSSRSEPKGEMRSTRARELLAQARESFRSQQYLFCLDRCEILVSNYADLLEGAEAAQLAAEIKSNPEWMQQVCGNLSERLGGLYLALAESWIQKGQPQQAIPCLERVVQMFPGSRYSEAAQTRLSQVQTRPSWQTNLKP